jgi:NAD(P)-dependent dehydrogenase (short-subunit alcohol dehydrogenase family)
VSEFPSLAERCVLVTGGSRGLGRAMVLGLLRAGARVATVGTGPSAAADETMRLAREIASASHFSMLFGDVSRPEDCDRIGDEALAAFGQIDVLVNNAASRTDYPGLPFWRMQSADWLKISHTNCDSVFLMSRRVVLSMIERGFGKIINITTNGRTMARENYSPYGPSKAFVEACTRAWSSELKGSGVTVNALLPGGLVDTSADGGTATATRGPSLPASVMVGPLLWLAADESNGISGQRFVANRWDTKLDVAARIEASRESGTATPSIM